MLSVEERRAAYKSGIEERQSRITELRSELDRLEAEVVYFRALAFEDETDVREDYKLVAPEDWEHLKVDQTIRVLILRQPGVGQESWYGTGKVVSYNGGWSRGVVVDGTHFNFVSNSAHPVVVTREGVELKIWKKEEA